MDAGVYYITGGLGGGKSAATVTKIREAIVNGQRVATNLDLDLEQLVGPFCKSARVTRLPDLPDIDDLNNIGEGYTHDDPKHYDEKQFGVLVLDELGTWFNSREWNKPGRREVVNWLLHARKRRWILLLIIQDLELLDNQAKAATAKDFVVYCKNLSRFSVPILSPIYKLFTGKKLTFPSLHCATVRNGLANNALVSERWWFTTHKIKTAYNTRQEFLTRDDPDSCRMHTVLAPWITHGRYRVHKNLDYYKKALEPYNYLGVVGAVASVLLLCAVVAYCAILQISLEDIKNKYTVVKGETINLTNKLKAIENGGAVALVKKTVDLEREPVKEPVKPVAKKHLVTCDELQDYRVTGTYGKTDEISVLFDFNGHVIKSRQLQARGYTVEVKDSCFVMVRSDQCEAEITCNGNQKQQQNKPLNEKSLTDVVFNK